MQRKQVLAILFVLLLSPLSHLWGDGLRINGDLSALMQPTEQPTETDQESSEAALVRNYPFLAYINFNASFQENMYLQSYTLLDVTVRENQSTLLDETIFYAMVGYRDLMNMFDFQAGRQFIITGFGFSMFDGALINFHMDKGPVKGLAVKAYGGIPVNEDFSQEKITDVIKSELLLGGAISYKWRKMNFGVDYREQQKDKEAIERLVGMDYDFQATRRFNVFLDGAFNLLADGGIYPQDVHLSTDWQIISKLRWVNSLEFYKPFLYNNSFMFNLYSNVTKEHINLNLTERIQAKERFVYMIGYGLAVSAYGGGNVFMTEHDIEGEPKNEFGFIAGLGLSSRKFLGTTFSLDGNMEQDPEYRQADFTLKVSKILYLPIISRLGLNMAGGMALYDTGKGQQNGYFVYLEAFFEIMRALNGYLLTEYYSNPVYGYDVRLVVKVNWKYDFSFFE